MKKKFNYLAVPYTIAVFYMLFAVGCSSASNMSAPQQQGYMAGGGKSTGQAQQMGQSSQPGMGQSAGQTQQTGQTQWMGNTTGLANTGWPGKPGSEPGLAIGGTRNTGTGAIQGPAEPYGRAAIIAQPTTDSDAGITLLNVISPVRQGEIGGLTIQGAPNTSYTVSATYVNSRGTMASSAAARSGADGRAGWAWVVKGDTQPGTYRLVISGGGKIITASYTVIR